jgi:hypothetical protein
MNPVEIKAKQPQTLGSTFICCGAGVAPAVVVAILVFMAATIIRPVVNMLMSAVFHTMPKSSNDGRPDKTLIGPPRRR